MIARSKYYILTNEIILPIAVILSVIAFYFSIFYSSLLNVKNVDCSIGIDPCPDSSTLIELRKLEGENMLLIDTQDTLNKIKSGDPTVSDIKIEKRYPNTLLVSIKLVEPTFALRLSGVENEWITLDNNYNVINLTSGNPELPTLIIPSVPALHIGKKIDDSSILSGLKLVSKLNDLTQKILEMTLVSDYVEGDLGEHHILMSIDESQVDDEIMILQAVLRDSKIVDGMATIDVRHGRPVIR